MLPGDTENMKVMSYMMQLLIYLLLIEYEIGLFCTLCLFNLILMRCGQWLEKGLLQRLDMCI